MRGIYERAGVEGLQVRNTFTPAALDAPDEERGEQSRPPSDYADGKKGGKKKSIVGRGIVYDDTTLIGDFFYERIAECAGDEDIEAGVVLARYNHSRLLGRQDNGSLILTPGPEGVDYRVFPNEGTGIGRDALAYAERGDLGGSSFVFRDLTVEREEKWKDGLDRYTVRKMRLFEMGPVDTPAYPTTGKPEARTAFGEMLRRAVVLRDGAAGAARGADEARVTHARMAALRLKAEVPR